MNLQLNTVAQSSLPVWLDWKVAATLPDPDRRSMPLGVAGVAAGVHHDVMLVAGGANFPDSMPWMGGVKKYHKEVFVFTQQADKSLQLLKRAELRQPVAYAASCTTPQGLLMAGGENEQGIRKDAVLLRWDEELSALHSDSLPSLPFGITNAMAVAVGGKVYVAGGEMAQGVSKSVFMLDLENLPVGWKLVAELPVAVSHGVLLAEKQGNAAMLNVVGGRARQPNGISVLYREVQVLNLKTKIWSQKKQLSRAMAAGTGVMLHGGDILLFGGDTGETFQEVERLIASIANATDKAVRQELNHKKITLQSNHPGFDQTVLLYSRNKNAWKKAGVLPFATPVTTCAVQWNGWVYLVSGEIKAGVRTPFIYSAKLSE